MGRHNRRQPVPEPREFNPNGSRKVESWPDGSWVTQLISGADSVKQYRCPGCDQVINPGVAHTVAWEYSGGNLDDGVEHRRHWHKACWTNRLNRR
ncbi:MAG: ATP/GTP-binding protein [Actinomycetales bacterium]|nr:ATP/GTP-binding protein [Actinomycetales bacterium]